jgi:hypothetical protein
LAEKLSVFEEAENVKEKFNKVCSAIEIKSSEETIFDDAEFFSLLETFATLHDEMDVMVRQHNQ